MTSLVSCTRVEIVRHVCPQMGYILQYLLSLLGFASSNCHLLEAGRKGAGEVFMEEGLCSFCTRNPNSGIFAVIRLPNTYRFSASTGDFLPKFNQPGKWWSISNVLLSVERWSFVFYLSLSSTVLTQDIRRKRLVADLPIHMAKRYRNKILPSKYHAIFHPRTPTNSKGSDGGNPMGSAVKKNGRGGICERKLFRAVLNWD